MKTLDSRLHKIFNQPYFPILLILIANLLIGVFTFRDYGLSWDEPLFYQYADAVPYAYSIPARLSGDFDIENAYGPSSEDHKIYGPIYLLLAKPAVDLFDWLSHIPRADLWHLVNFLTFQVGVFIFFALCLRWMSTWVAFGATLLFSTQPVIWGHSWINPKDISFTVFFLAAIYFGYKMIDALSGTEGESLVIEDERIAIDNSRRKWKLIRILALLFTALTLISFALSNQLYELLGWLIHTAYQSSTTSLLGKLFSSLAENMKTIPEEAYINKGWIVFIRLRPLLIILSMIFLVPVLLDTFCSGLRKRISHWAEKTLGPAPQKIVWGWGSLSSTSVILKIFLAGAILGMLVSIRVIGPLAGVLVILYFLFKPGHRAFAGIIIYGVVAIITMILVWPYLWEAPLRNFLKVLQHMSHNPQILPVLFSGVVTRSDILPFSYLPVMLGITLTWPVWPLFFAGLWTFWVRIKSRQVDWRSLTPIALWFLIPFIYVLIVRPPMYDGYRHFLFILPPVFILSGLAIQALWERLRNKWSYALILAVLVVPGVIGLVRLHPYEYTYYNLLVGETGGAYRRYETDFWLTCYKELMAEVDEKVSPGSTLFVHRQPSIAQEYTPPGIFICRYDPDNDRTFSGSLLLLTTRANSDLSIHPEALEILRVGREGATFCLVKVIP